MTTRIATPKVLWDARESDVFNSVLDFCCHGYNIKHAVKEGRGIVIF